MGSHEPEGYACSVLHLFCYRVGHMEGVCEVKDAAQGATPSSCSVLLHCAAPHYKLSSTLQSLQLTPATISTFSYTNLPTPQTMVQTMVRPQGDLHESQKGSGCSSPSWVASQSVLHATDPSISLGCPAAMSHAQGPDPYLDRVGQHGCPGWWVGVAGRPPRYLH